jgi:hypothetical protein
MPNKPDDEAVRIFIEFSNQAQAIKAFVGMQITNYSVRFFAQTYVIAVNINM